MSSSCFPFSITSWEDEAPLSVAVSETEHHVVHDPSFIGAFSYQAPLLWKEIPVSVWDAGSSLPLLWPLLLFTLLACLWHNYSVNSVCWFLWISNIRTLKLDSVGINEFAISWVELEYNWTELDCLWLYYIGLVSEGSALRWLFLLVSWAHCDASSESMAMWQNGTLWWWQASPVQMWSIVSQSKEKSRTGIIILDYLDFLL